MQIIKESPVFQAGAKTGETKYWKFFVSQDGDGNVYTYSESWRSTKGGESAHITNEPKLIKGKNLGRANETTPEQQAFAEFESAINLKRDKGYRLPGEAKAELPLPMLAMDYKKRKAALPAIVSVQPKLDGVRALSNGEVFWSRQGKTFIPQVIDHLRLNTQDQILDGELILPAPYTFQQTISAIKKFDPELSPKLEYHVYDIVDAETAFEQRFQIALSIVEAGEISQVKPVETHQASANPDQKAHPSIEQFHAQFTEAGYEGTMIRIPSSKYLINHRSNDLLKFKDFIDDEFEVVDVLEGEAKEKGHAIFVVKTANGQTFNARPRGTSDYRQQLWRDRSSLIGKMLTIRYQNLSDTGIPRFPVGLALRDYE